MQYELTIPFRSPLRAVTFADAKAEPARVPTPPASSPPPLENHRRPERDTQPDEEAAIKNVLDGVRRSLSQLQSDNLARVDELQRFAIDLAVTIASRLIHAKIEAGEFGLEAMIRDASNCLTGKQPVDIRLHPEDARLLEARVPSLATLLPNRLAGALIGDDSIRRGEARLQAGDVTVESLWRTQLDEIHQHMLRSVGHANTGS